MNVITLKQEDTDMQTTQFVYLTFDDGPLAGTDDCLAVLGNKSIKGTFFMVGSHMTTAFRKQQVETVKTGGHFHGNHSANHWHGSSNYASGGKTNAEWLADFQSCDTTTAAIRNEPGTKYIHARLPGKNCWRLSSISTNDGNSQRVADHLSSNGYQIYGWDTEWKYSGTAAASDPIGTPEDYATEVANKINATGQTKLPNKAMVLLHGHQFRNSRGNKTKFSEFIDKLKQKLPNAVFKTVDTYLTD
ncbi:polysaccharide deacetylase family protein [Mariniblastus sp.]|nr:polysaccharide deacetylase family protein [Mariniblastus sp.]